MTENPNETFCSTQFYNQIKRELTNSPCTNDVALGFYNNGINIDNTPTSQLTDSHLKYNVHIVLENLKRSVEKTYLHDNANNNNCGSNNNTINTTNNNQKNYQQHSSSNNNNHINSFAAVNNQTTTKFGSSDPTTVVDNSQIISKTATANPLNNKAGENMSSPESDCNSNVHANHMQQLASSIASSHDFTHDNSDYQWFLDYK